MFKQLVPNQQQAAMSIAREYSTFIRMLPTNLPTE